MTLLRRLVCALAGHVWAPVFTGAATYLVCDRCDKEERIPA